jgi:hypothetical protein
LNAEIGSSPEKLIVDIAIENEMAAAIKLFFKILYPTGGN